jgi:hypothetical protein
MLYFLAGLAGFSIAVAEIAIRKHYKSKKLKTELDGLDEEHY